MDTQTPSSFPNSDHKRKVYISLLIIVVVACAIAYIVMQYGERRIQKRKEALIEELQSAGVPSFQQKEAVIESLRTTSQSDPAMNEQVKKDLIKGLK